MGSAFGDVVYAEKKLLPGVGGRWGVAGPEILKLSLYLRRLTSKKGKRKGKPNLDA